MDDADVRPWLADTFDVSRETLEKLDRYVELLLAEAERQNLIASSTLPIVWDRHIRDSAQLLGFARDLGAQGSWLDLGSGPGLPGIVIALLNTRPITLVESRARRAGFLFRAVEELALSGHVTVEARRLERIETRPFDIITARAFAPLPKLFDLAHRFSRRETLWLLPKGQTVDDELEAVRPLWQGEFDTVQSLTDPRSSIICARKVRPRRR
ncbi:MAG: 16S rRNA (guanine(527)-N(7))-methyltransferase RsmG [Sphingomonadaceae bacterium]|nr:16S rRNA (guanine(527)-N(7))-methyltransferase RsmG [Sphingomonadaceae bacterium]